MERKNPNDNIFVFMDLFISTQTLVILI